jgi:hypothetical protein
MEKYIKLIKKAILKEIDNDRTIKTLDVDFTIDGADNPIIKVKLKTCKKVKKSEKKYVLSDYDEFEDHELI